MNTAGASTGAGATAAGASAIVAGASATAAGAAGSSFTEYENRVLELCEKFKTGVKVDVLQSDMPNLSKKEVVDLLNSLLHKGKLELRSLPDGTLVYKLKDPVLQHKMKGINREDQVVYELIERSGSFGIWTRKIRQESNLYHTAIDRVLKRLEGKKLIKSINSVSAPKKKIYLISSVEPDKSLTGGAFYSDNKFDTAFVDILMETCYKYMENKRVDGLKKHKADGPLAAFNAGKVDGKEMLEYITKIKVSKIKLGVDDVEKLLDTLVLDAKVMCFEIGSSGGNEEAKLYLAIVDSTPTPHILEAPCGVCRLVGSCSDIGSITPASCAYMDDWLR